MTSPTTAAEPALRTTIRDWAEPNPARPRVVVIGAGFAGLYAARELRKADEADVLVLDRTNHHLFQPLLYQVATSVLAPSDITSPIRSLLRKQRNTTVLLADVHGVDVERKVVVADGGTGVREVPYDYLIVAAGASHSYFGHPEWERLAPGLKSIEDAREIRRRFLMAFENAEKSDDAEKVAEWLTFVIVGGGPTGVELAGMIPDVAHHGMHADFRRIDTMKTRVILLEGGPRVLPSFPEELSDRAAQDLRALGVDVRTGSLVTRITPLGVYVGEEFIPTRTVFWAAGNEASYTGESLGAPTDRQGRVLVEPDLSIPGHPEVFVVGDQAAFRQPNGELVPGVAPAAMQEGRWAAKNVIRSLRGDDREPFQYFNKGNLATIGRNKAVADFGRLQVAGWVAWWLWLLVHILYLAGFRNRASVLLEWGYSYFTYQRGSRLITQKECD